MSQPATNWDAIGESRRCLVDEVSLKEPREHLEEVPISNQGASPDDWTQPIELERARDIVADATGVA